MHSVLAFHPDGQFCATNVRARHFRSARGRGRSIGRNRRRRLNGLLLLEARAAQHGPSLRRPERNRCLYPAGRAVRSCFRPYPRTAVRTLRLALFAAFGVVLEIFIVEEKLLPRRKDEVGAAINALQNLIREFHGRLPRRWESAEIGHDLGCAGPVFPVFVRCPTTRGPGRIRSGRLEFASSSSREDRDDIAPSPNGAKDSAVTNQLPRPFFVRLSAGKAQGIE